MLLRTLYVTYIIACINRYIIAWKAQTKQNGKKKFTSAVAVVLRKMALAFIPAAVSHAQYPYHTPV